MKLNWPVEIAGTGASMPAQVVTNEAFTQRLETTDEWIVQRTGIHERRIAPPEEATLKYATEASRAALAEAGVSPAELDLIVCATITPEHILPSTACELQNALGCRWIPAFDLSAACSGFVYGIVTAAQYIVNGLAKNVLLVGAECLSRITDMEDRTSCILFGDGAAAAVLRPASDPSRGVLAARMGADGGRAQLIWVPGGGAREPASVRTVSERLHFMRMKGREVYKFAVTQMQELIHETLSDAGVSLDDVALLVPHQSNLRIIESACEKLGLPESKVVVNIQRYGNTSAASVPIALHEARQAGRVKKGDLVLMVAFGAGLTWASALMRV